VPALRHHSTEVTRTAARRFNQVAWQAFAVLAVTDVWNMIAESDHIKGRYQTTRTINVWVNRSRVPHRACPASR
jgi:hypothetical protein